MGAFFVASVVGCGATTASSARPASFFAPGASGPAPSGLCPIAGVTSNGNRTRLTLGGDVSFDYDKSDLKPAARDVLARAKATLIDAHPDATITVEGHTDDRGSADYNQGLSERRAQAVAAWLTQNGVAPGRVSTQGYGKKWPRVPNSSDANRAINRRVELVVAWGDGRVAGLAGRTCSAVQACCELASVSGKPGPEPGCIGKEPGPSGWGDDLASRALEENNGVLRLNPCLATRDAAVWITSTDEDKIARLNESDGKQLFRVPTHGKFPQRTAIAADGSAWVTNRDSGSYVHLSGDGKLLCSSPLDTCETRAATIDSRGHAWIGCYEQRMLLQVSGDETDGTVTLPLAGGGTETVPKCKEVGRMQLEDTAPYGLVADRDGGLWTGLSGGGPIQKIDTIHRTVALKVDPSGMPEVKSADGEICWSPYGIAIDRAGNPWYANMSCGSVVKFDGATGKLLGVYYGGKEGLRSPRALGIDQRGHAWVSENERPFVNELSSQGAFIKRVDTTSCGEGASPLGVAADSRGDLWVALPGAGKVMKFRTDGTILGCYPDGDVPPFVNPYTYSDFTGAALEFVHGERGVARVRFDHAHPVRWRLASFSRLLPADTGLCVRARSAGSVAALERAAWSADECSSSPGQANVNLMLDGSKGAVKVAEGTVLELEFALRSAVAGVSPLVAGVSVAATPTGR
jgi:outer membrane protein OmpA-like peptidoglycan-associated protein/streptogramin lyase